METVYYSRQYLKQFTLGTLRVIAEQYGIESYVTLKKEELIAAIYDAMKKRKAEEEAQAAAEKKKPKVEKEISPPKTQEELDFEFREQYRVKEDRDDGIVRYDPFSVGLQLSEKERTARFEDQPLRPAQTLEEIRKEIIARRELLIPVKNDDGTTLYLGDTPTPEQIEYYYKRSKMGKEDMEKNATVGSDEEAKTKRKYTRKKKADTVEGEMTEQEKLDMEKSLETTEEEYRDLFNVDRVAPEEKKEADPIEENDAKDESEGKKRAASTTYGEGYKNKKKQFNGSYGDKNKGENRDTEEDVDSAPLEYKEGVLEIMADGYGFLRAHNYESGENDAYVSAQRIRRSGLRKGDYVKAEAKKICDNRPAGIVNVLEVNGCAPESAFHRKNFDSLTPIYPDVRYRLEIPGKSTDFAIRCIDLVAPIGKGQRSMIVSPPKAGKTTLLKSIARSIAINYPEAYLMVLLVDERPEEVTDMQRSINGEVIYSTFDEMPEHHTKAAELVLERAKRLVEMDKDVVILMDSLTRLARAYNLTISPTGRTLSGGIDPGALHSPKRFFGAARNIEHGGSLTIIATALVDTGSRMDDVIYEEFKGTGNMEIHLDRRLSERRIFPAIDLYRSGTRRDEMLLDQDEIGGIWGVRKMLSMGGDTSDSTETLINMMIKTKTNKEFIEQLNVQLKKMKDNGYMN